MIVRSEKLRLYPEIIQGFSSIEEGNMAFKYSVDSREVIHNRNKVLSRSIPLAGDEFNIYEAEPVHKTITTNIVDLKQSEVLERFLISGSDGVISKIGSKNTILVCTFADCLPIFFYDPKNKIIGLAHAGWRGVVGGMCVSLVNKMINLGSNAEDLIVYIGPSVKDCCFKVHKDTYKIFEKEEYSIYCISENDDGRRSINLQKYCANILVDLGVSLDNIEISEICTCCDERFFSHRRQASDRDGGNLGFIVI